MRSLYCRNRGSQMIEKLRQSIAALQEAVEKEIEEKRRDFRYTLKRGRVIFDRDALAEHRLLRQGVRDYLRTSRILYILSSPFIYGMAVPLVLLDVSVTLFQWICFPVYGVPRVKRGDYMFFDRHFLGYLNAIEKINCLYCEYANGVIAYAREIASRTEQFWCPIKHARKLKDPHARYFDFIEYGDSELLRDKWRDQREKCRACQEPCGK